MQSPIDNPGKIPSDFPANKKPNVLMQSGEDYSPCLNVLIKIGLSLVESAILIVLHNPHWKGAPFLKKFVLYKYIISVVC